MIVAVCCDGAIIFRRVIGKPDLLRVACDKCGPDGGYDQGRLIEKRGRDAKRIDWLDDVTAECRRRLHTISMIHAVRDAGIWRGCCNGTSDET